jgi:DNA-binding ferritin-like protein
MKDIKLNQIQPVGGRAGAERTQAPGKKPAGDFGKALEQAQAGTAPKPNAGLRERTRSVIENFQKDEAQFNELMKASQHQAKLIQSMMSRKSEKES